MYVVTCPASWKILNVFHCKKILQLEMDFAPHLIETGFFKNEVLSLLMGVLNLLKINFQPTNKALEIELCK